MNQCGLAPNTKSAVLRAAVENGLRFGMRSIEIYGADIDDVELRSEVAWADSALHAQAVDCLGALSVDGPVPADAGIDVYPNPASISLTIASPNTVSSLSIVDLHGRVLLSRGVDSGVVVDLGGIPAGVYLAVMWSSGRAHTRRFAIVR